MSANWVRNATEWPKCMQLSLFQPECYRPSSTGQYSQLRYIFHSWRECRCRTHFSKWNLTKMSRITMYFTAQRQLSVTWLEISDCWWVHKLELPNFPKQKQKMETETETRKATTGADKPLQVTTVHPRTSSKNRLENECIFRMTKNHIRLWRVLKTLPKTNAQKLEIKIKLIFPVITVNDRYTLTLEGKDSYTNIHMYMWNVYM